MADIRAFRSLRPTSESVQRLVSVPYDVVSRAEARKLAEGKDHSFLRVVRSDLELADTIGAYEDAVYERAWTNLSSFLERGFLTHESRPALLIYRLTMGKHTQTGVVAVCNLSEYDSGEIRIHEYTRHEKELDRIRHILATGTQCEPVFLTYRAKESINKLVDAATSDCAPLFDVTTEDGVRHELWEVASASELQDEFRSVERLYIADGHHRSAAAAKARSELGASLGKDQTPNFVLATIFPHDQLQILPYNRIIRESALTDSEILSALEQNFVVQPTNAGTPTHRGQFVLYLGGFWYQLELKIPTGGSRGDSVGAVTLDVDVLQRSVLAPIFGIDDPRTDKKVDFVGGIRGISELERLVARGEARCAFSLFPVAIENLFEIADRGEVMPPKSTWFEPKLRSGFFIYPYWRSVADKNSFEEVESA